MSAPVVQVANGLLYPALRKAGVTIGPGRTPSNAQFEDAIGELNRLAGSLNCDRLFIYSIARQQFVLTPAKAAYTIGIASSGPPADFPVERPHGIESANIIGSGAPDAIRYRLAVVTALQWAEIGYQTLPGGIPEILYDDRANPVSTLYFYGQPAPGQLLELFTWTLVPQFQTATDLVELPPGYEDALVLNLAVRLAPHFQRPVDPNVRADARESLMRLESINAPRPIASFDDWWSGCGCRGFDVYSGN